MKNPKKQVSLFVMLTLLKTGRVLITVGYTDGNIVSANAGIYKA